MTIILFLVDSSASMNQRTYTGLSLLDVAKGVIDTFLKLRQKDPSRSQDRYMLLSFEDPPNNVKAGWKENQVTFAQELKALKGVGLTSFGPALANAFHLLNINRLQSGIDTYGSGRCPFYIEQTLVVVLTDGNSLLTGSGMQKEVELVMPPFPGSELTKEPFRWDQRVFSLILRIPGCAPSPLLPVDPRIPVDQSPVNVMCEVTGGRSYCITNHRALNICVESLVQKVQSGVVVSLEQWGPDPILMGRSENDIGDKNHLNHDSLVDGVGDLMGKNKSKANQPLPQDADIRDWHSVTKMIFVPRTTMKGVALGHWPIPEAFWPDQNSSCLVPRSSHPLLKFKCDDVDPLLIESFPFDKYELEPSPLTQLILQRKQPNICWQLFAPGSACGKNDMGFPFGYLKASSALNTVNMYVMAYNYPVLIPLIDDLLRNNKGRITPQWRVDFERYYKSIPIYYLPFLKRAMTRINAANALPDNVEQVSLSYSVLSYLKRVKHQAKMEYDRLCQCVLQAKSVSFNSIQVFPRRKSEATKIYSDPLLDRHDALTLGVMFDSKFSSAPPAAQFRNPFDVSRVKLLDQLVKMRKNLSHLISNSSIPLFEGGFPGTKLNIQNAEELHSLPIAQMGNYQDYLRLLPQALREVEAAPVRQHAFGNPFKVDKRMLVDEADIDNLMIATDRPGTPGASQSVKGSRKTSATSSDSLNTRLKRKRGPLPRHLRFKRWKRLDSESGSVVFLDDSSANDTESVHSEADVESLEDDGGIVFGSVSVPNGTAAGFMPTTGFIVLPVPSPQQVSSENELKQIRQSIRRLIRTPGKQEAKRMQDEIAKASEDCRPELVKFCTTESNRFKRRRLEGNQSNV